MYGLKGRLYLCLHFPPMDRATTLGSYENQRNSIPIELKYSIGPDQESIITLVLLVAVSRRTIQTICYKERWHICCRWREAFGITSILFP